MGVVGLASISWHRRDPIVVFVVVTISLYNFGGVRRSVAVTTKKRVKPGSVRLVPKPSRGRPPVHHETWSKVSVVLFDRQIIHLDRLTTDIRGKNGKAINRAEIIRALIDGLIESGMDITASASEADLRARVARRLGTPFR
jgi:hypothetical protein